MTDQPRLSITARVRAAAEAAVARGCEVEIAMPDGTVIRARPAQERPVDDLSLIDMSKR